MRNKTILLVEDEAIIALSQSQTIESYGYRVITAMSGEEALEIVTGNQSIDLVLMDIDLGAGMDGTETAERIMKLRMLPIVFLTSHTEKEMVDRVKGITRYGYVVKNSGEFVLMESINMAFELYDAHRQTLREEEKFHAYIDNAPFGIFVVNGEGQYIDVNHEACRMTGYVLDELLHMGIVDLAPVNQEDLAKESFRTVKKHGEVHDVVELRRKDGSTFLASLDTVPLKGNRYMAFCADETVRLEYEKDLEESNATLQAVLDASPIGIGFVKDRKWIWVNTALKNMLKYQSDEYMQKDVLGLYPDESEYARVGKELYGQIDENGSGQMDARLQDRQGNVLDVMIMARALDKSRVEKGQIITVADMTDQLEKEKLTRKSENEKSMILNAMKEHVVYYNPDMQIQWCNRAAAASVGKQPEELKEQYCYQVWQGREEPCDICPVRDAASPCQVVQYTNTNVSGRKWDVHVYPVCEDGKVVGYIEVTSEITEKQVMEEKLKRSERRFRELADMLPEAVFEADLAGKVTYGNKMAFEIMGYTRREFEEGFTADQMVVPGDRQRVVENIVRLINGEQLGPIEYTMQRKDGKTFPALVNASCILDEGEVQGIRGLVIDISGLKNTLASLENNRNMLQAILQNMSGGTIIIDEDYRIFQVNDRTAEISGYELTELIGEKCDIICPKGSASKQCPIWEEKEQGFTGMDTTLKRRDGTHVPILKNAKQVTIDGKLYVLENFQEITDIKNAEAEIQNLLSQKDMILREVHHRIKNDMNVINSLLSLQANSSENVEVSRILQEVRHRIYIMSSIYNTLYRGEQVKSIHIPAFISDVTDSIAQTYTVNTRVTLDRQIDDVWIPAKMSFSLGIIINELVTNAFKYAFNGSAVGKISITIRQDEENNLRVIIADNGIGLPGKYKDITNPGFGLTLVDAMVRQCRGTYTIRNDNGTHVDILIPAGADEGSDLNSGLHTCDQ
ncbi:MAG: PAS domain S-box protein [Spirochaetota bacterium]